MLKGIEFLRRKSWGFNTSPHSLSSLRVKRSNPLTSPHAGEGLHRPWCHKILGTRPRMTGGGGANSSGRSMIEMLGVLAIIAVLSVGGIAGYSKAMLMWRSNIQKNMLTEIITNMIKIRPNLNKTQAISDITPVFDAMGELPEGTTYQNGYIYDKDGNRVDIFYGLQTLNYSDGHKTEAFIYVVRFWFMSNEKRLTPSAKVYCRNLVEAAQSVVSEIQQILFIQTDSKGEFGSSSISLFNKNSLRNATLNEINQKCEITMKEGGSSRFTLYINPY